MNHNQSNSVQSFENFATYFENRMMQEDSIGEKSNPNIIRINDSWSSCKNLDRLNKLILQ
jgi:hypothetical protein